MSKVTLTSSSRLGLTLPTLPILRMFSVMGERRRLSQLSDKQLDDIGMTYADAAREANRPFWDLPRR